jgi:hypothetical protein
MFPKLSAGSDAGGLVAAQERGGEDIPEGLKPRTFLGIEKAKAEALTYLEGTAKTTATALVRATKHKARGARAERELAEGYGERLPAGVELVQNAL